MPESAARINPLRPRVCTIRLCLGEPPLRGARVRASLLARVRFYPYMYAYSRKDTHIHAPVHATLVTLARTHPGGVETRHGSPSALLNPATTPSKREGYHQNPSIEHHWSRHVPVSWSRLATNSTNNPADSSNRATPREAAARTTSFVGE